MTRAVKAKFAQNKDLAKRPIDTGDVTLIEGNTWNDTFWSEKS